MQYSSPFLVYTWAWIRHIKYIVMITKEGFIKIVNFMTHGAGFHTLGRGHISHNSENILSSTLSIYITLIDNVLRDNNAELLFHC